MKRIFFVMLLPAMLLTGNAFAADLTGLWRADNYCTPCSDIESDKCVVKVEPTVKYEESYVLITQEGDFFNTDSWNDECGGLLIGKGISMTCPPTGDGTGTIFQGELKGPNIIEGVNFNPSDGSTCSVTAYREDGDSLPPPPDDS
jgi:hypothetical protein